MIEVKAPGPFHAHVGLRVFLAGSIEMGAAEDWQARLVSELADLPNLVLLNPRREAWDASWRQELDEPRFRTQVEWELDGLEAADLVAMNLLPETRAPVSLLELGLTAARRSLLVCCPPGYWRRGNVQVVAARFGHPCFDDEPSWRRAVRTWAEARVGEPLLRPPPSGRELEEREEAIRRDPSPENLGAWWTLLRRLGVAQHDEFRIDIPGAQGWGRADWRITGSLVATSLATLGKEVGDPGPHLALGLVSGGDDVPPPDRHFLVRRRVVLDVRALEARFDADLAVNREALRSTVGDVEPPEAVLRVLRDWRHQAVVPLRTAMADMAGWLRLESRRSLARAVPRLSVALACALAS